MVFVCDSRTKRIILGLSCWLFSHERFLSRLRHILPDPPHEIIALSELGCAYCPSCPCRSRCSVQGRHDGLAVIADHIRRLLESAAPVAPAHLVGFTGRIVRQLSQPDVSPIVQRAHRGPALYAGSVAGRILARWRINPSRRRSPISCALSRTWLRGARAAGRTGQSCALRI